MQKAPEVRKAPGLFAFILLFFCLSAVNVPALSKADVFFGFLNAVSPPLRHCFRKSLSYGSACLCPV